MLYNGYRVGLFPGGKAAGEVLSVLEIKRKAITALMSLIFSTEMSLFFDVMLEKMAALLRSWLGFKTSVAI